jgi:O-glycosyl hydrolase
MMAGEFDANNVTAMCFIDPSIRHQTIDGFGASGAWYTSNVLHTCEDCTQVVDLAFNGLQLDIFRIRNTHQQPNTETAEDFKRMKDAGEAASGRRLKILLSAWSPPNELKSNGKVGGGGTIAKDDFGKNYRYEDYAQWWA